MKIIPFNRDLAVGYARRWAMLRNRNYYDFENIGGDCTNFASQCIFAGSGVMNYTSVMGWYYRSLSDRTPSWSGVEFLYRFLVNNKSVGPFAHEIEASEVQPGDIVQLGNSQKGFYHSPVITVVKPTILVAAHTFDALDRPLNTYIFEKVRFIHIDGVRKW